MSNTTKTHAMDMSALGRSQQELNMDKESIALEVPGLSLFYDTKQALHDVLDYTPYEGIAMRGEVVRTLLRGKTVFLRGKGAGEVGVLSAERGGGQFIKCGRPDLLGWSGNWPDDGDIVQQHVVATLGPKLDGEVEGEGAPSGVAEPEAAAAAQPSGATGIRVRE